jgi:hypothetical protein
MVKVAGIIEPPRTSSPFRLIGLLAFIVASLFLVGGWATPVSHQEVEAEPSPAPEAEEAPEPAEATESEATESEPEGLLANIEQGIEDIVHMDLDGDGDTRRKK